MISELPSPSRQSLLVLLAALCVASVLSGCKPGNRTLCRSLGEIAETHDDEAGEDWHIALDVTLSDEDSCVEYLKKIENAHGDDWNDISLCYVRAREWSNVVTCDRVVATLDVSEICYHRLELEQLASPVAPDSAEADEDAPDRRTVEYARRNALAACVDDERVRYRAAPGSYTDYAGCVLAATTSGEAEGCVIEGDDELTDEVTEISDEEADEPAAAAEDTNADSDSDVEERSDESAPNPALIESE